MKRILLFTVMLTGGLLFTSCNQQQAKTAETTEPAPVVAEKTVELPADAIRIAAIVTLKDAAFAADFEKVAAEVVAGSRAEEGCVYYELGKSTTPLTYAFIEVWKSQDAINTHNETPHFKAFVKAIEGKADLNVCMMNKLF
ncbi:MAG: putative quinol monooxygenase [Massilibacteroides sp.]|nr:putative quinol monooxygenase [Massilibacteroides sp.]MDD3062638.1 putative quinol monooxygenase [Massilibacteroides sp.]MDD4116031.1 putative quinol monooxygenase [Massilibacteroides sp.]MDD4659533.1 putative quinol monooxygenase [Massilibacteroides sp.]